MNGIKPQSTRPIYQIGSKTNLYILFEHKSKGDKKTLVQMSSYMSAIHSEKQLEFFRICMQYIYRARPKDRETDYFQILEEEHMPKLKEEALTIAERLQKEGREIGMKEGKLEDARRMKAKGLDADLILEITGLSQQDLQEAGILD